MPYTQIPVPRDLGNRYCGVQTCLLSVWQISFLLTLFDGMLFCSALVVSRETNELMMISATEISAIEEYM